MSGAAIWCSIIIGSLSATLILVVAFWTRASWIRAAGGESYYRGWKDGVKEAKSQIECWVKTEPPQRNL